MVASLLLSDPLTALNGFGPFILAAIGLLVLGYLGLLYLAVKAARQGSSLGALCLLMLAAAGVSLGLYLWAHNSI